MSKRIIAIILASVIVLGGILMSAMTTVVSSLMSGDFNINKEATSTVLEEGDSNKKIAEIVVEGEIIDTGASGGLFGGGARL